MSNRDLDNDTGKMKVDFENIKKRTHTLRTFIFGYL